MGAPPLPSVQDGPGAHLDSTLVQQVLDIPKQQGEVHVHQRSEPDRFERDLQVAEVAALGHGKRAGSPLRLAAKFV